MLVLDSAVRGRKSAQNQVYSELLAYQNKASLYNQE